MTPWLAASLLVFLIVNLFRLFGLVEKSRRVFPIALHSLGTIQNPCLGDEAKEVALKKNAMRMFALFFQLVFCAAGALLFPLAGLWLIGRTGLVSLAAVEKVTLSPVFLAGGSCFAIAFFWFTSPSQGSSPPSYSFLDRLSHQLAFNTGLTQIGLARLEDKLLATKRLSFRGDNPVFITAMPRAGTTLLLDCLAKHPEFASHCYRDMPFLLIPWFWSRFSALFRKKSVSQERAHGDGMLIDFDSPEAFEELVWKTFWYEKYQEDGIPLWGAERNGKFERFFTNHIKKIIYIRGGEDAAFRRYVSKNNQNISRIPLLRDMFPSCTILVPFRHPLQHCASLLRQHENFDRIHRQDPFASEYMKAIGHFDFGENLLPVDFDSWYHRRKTQSAFELPFWLEYWNACYGWMLEKGAQFVSFVNYAALCANPAESFRAIAEKLGVHDQEAFLTIAKDVHPLRLQEVNTSGVPDDVLRKSIELYTALQQNSLNPYP